MGFNLRNRSFLSLLHHTPDEIRFILDLARDLKHAKYSGTEQQHLQGKNIALLFEKVSTRTRCAFEVAAYDQGAHVTYIDALSSHIAHKESIKDTARVLGRMYDAIEYRGFKQELVEQLDKYAGVPVFNGLTDQYHPTQVFADVLTMCENSDKPLDEISYLYIGDAHNNIANSLLIMGTQLGMDVRICAPKDYWPEEDLIKKCYALSNETGARTVLSDSPQELIKNVDYIYTDVWVSMGESTDIWDERIKKLKPYQVNQRLMNASGNKRTKFMHCLPALHNDETVVGRQLIEKYPEFANGIEVTEAVFESPANIAFTQAENRMHTVKAILVAALANL